jgi:hypothetical protein
MVTISVTKEYGVTRDTSHFVFSNYTTINWIADNSDKMEK